jgi:hypothetical protein
VVGKRIVAPLPTSVRLTVSPPDDGDRVPSQAVPDVALRLSPVAGLSVAASSAASAASAVSPPVASLTVSAPSSERRSDWVGTTTVVTPSVPAPTGSATVSATMPVA